MPYGQKWCTKCHAFKPIADFRSMRGSTEYHYCRYCVYKYQKDHRDGARSNSIPLTCPICGVKFSNDVRPDWDHDHETGLERDYLCRPCNLMIGYVKGDTSLFLQAIEYLRFHSEPNMTVFVDKKILSAYDVEDDTKCACGGFRNVVHCPRCGSTQCYANKRASPQALLPGLELPTQVRAFRCKLCSELFSEVDTVNACKAKTRYRQTLEQEERVNRVVDKASPRQLTDVEQAVQRIKERRGLVPPVPIDETTAKLFEPPVLDNGEETKS